MKITKWNTILPTLFLTAILSSCQKEKYSEGACPLNMLNLSGSYRLLSMKYQATNNAAEQDWLVFKDPCELDDTVTLNPNGTYHYEDAGLSCSPNESNGGTWSLTGNTINSDSDIDGTITSFDCKTLVFFASDIYLPGDKLITTITKN
jgi:hypothetical protein